MVLSILERLKRLLVHEIHVGINFFPSFLHVSVLAHRQEQESLKMKKVYATLGVLKNAVEVLSKGSISPEVVKPQHKLAYTEYLYFI
jgi:hypothetical protein